VLKNKPDQKENIMEITQGIVVKISTNKDQTYRVVVDIDKAYAKEINLLKWQDQKVTIQQEGDNG
jgi:hypothetical protein